MPEKKKTSKSGAARPASTAQEWRKQSQSAAGELVVPSGNVCLVRRPGLGAFLAQGLIPNSLMGLLQDASKGKGVEDATLQRSLGEIAKDPKKLQDMLELVDAVAIHCVVQPKIRWGKWTQRDAERGLCDQTRVGEVIPQEDRDEELLYVDEVDEDDKMFIFNWAVGGDRDVDRFREQQAELMESVSAGEDVGNDAIPASGASSG